MYAGEQLKYGWIRGGKVSTQVPIAATQTIVAASGRFVYMNAGAATIADDGQDHLFGFLEAPAAVSPTTGTLYDCIIDMTAVYRIPVGAGTYVAAMLGDTCDIIITAGIQGADLTGSTDNVLTIVGGDAVNNKYVDVMLTPKEWAQQTIAS